LQSVSLPDNQPSGTGARNLFRFTVRQVAAPEYKAGALSLRLATATLPAATSAKKRFVQRQLTRPGNQQYDVSSQIQERQFAIVRFPERAFEHDKEGNCHIDRTDQRRESCDQPHC